MICIKCPYYSKEQKLCDADVLRGEYAIECLLKMILMQMWFLNIDDSEEGEDWKYGK